ncbi:MAG: RidA family protein [Gammaproteobacteria bacterium]
MKRTATHSDQAPQAIGPYSQAVWSDDLLFLSGQTPIDPATASLIEGDIGEQTQRVFDNLLEVLKSAGLGFEHAIKLNVYLTDMADFAGMNEVYLKQFSSPFPSRTTVAVAGLPLGAKVEIEMVARKTP